MSYVYDEDGTLIAQTLTGGASTTWGQSARYIYLPTASGPMPVAAIYGTKHYAIQSDHLNTPRRLIQSDGQVAWQWAYSAFGDEQPTIAKNRFANTALNQSFGSTTVTAVTFNLRYPGQYFDQESDLHYNYHRSYSARIGRYTQSDPIGLRGGTNLFSYVENNSLSKIDPFGLASCIYHVRSGLMWCISNGKTEVVMSEKFAAGNNSEAGCKDNPDCESKSNIGPIPRGCYIWDGGSTSKPGGRTLVPSDGVKPYGRDLFRTHSCQNAFGPSVKGPFCSEGCITSSPAVVDKLNRILDAEPRSQLCVVD